MKIFKVFSIILFLLKVIGFSFSNVLISYIDFDRDIGKGRVAIRL